MLETWGLCFAVSVNLSRLTNIRRRHLRSAWKLVTEKEKHLAMKD